MGGRITYWRPALCLEVYKLLMSESFKRARQLLVRLREEAKSPEERELLSLAYFTFDFIEVTGSFHPFEEFLATWRRAGGSLPTVASFDTREGAETWLREHPMPPHGAYVLIAGRTHAVFCPERGGPRRMLPMPPLPG
jgi:hypothetical protein